MSAPTRQAARRILSDLEVIRWLLNQSRRYWGGLGCILLLELSGIPLQLLTPLPLTIVVDSAIDGKPMPALLRQLVPLTLSGGTNLSLAVAVTLVVLIALVTRVQGFATWLLQTYVGEKLVLQNRSMLLAHVQRLSSSFHDKHGTAQSSYRILFDAKELPWLIMAGLFPLIISLLSLASMLVVTARLSLHLAVAAMSITPLILLVVRHYRPRLRHQWKEVKTEETTLMSNLQEMLGAFRVIQAFGREATEQKKFHKQSMRTLAAKIRVARNESVFSVLLGLIVAFGTSLVLYIGAKDVVRGTLTTGQLLLVMSYIASLLGPLQSLGEQVGSLQGQISSAHRVIELLDEPPSVVESAHALPLRRTKGEVSFDRVSFAYEDGSEVLTNLSFHVPPGSRVGIAGHTGAGKTTLINLIMRFYDPTEGSIRLDGHDLRDYRIEDLRRQFSVVLQDSVLFSASIRENIAYGRPDASDGEIIQAAIAANADEFIQRMEEGYDTLVGERGMNLSGGQRQRIGLARAFLRDAPLLILDEPTSALDIHTESMILEALDRLSRDRTSFIIAHRPTTLKSCDFILVLDHGQLRQISHQTVPPPAQ